jgi:hypothetical protein
MLALVAAASLLAGTVQARSSSKPARGVTVGGTCHRAAHPKRGTHRCVQSRRPSKIHGRTHVVVKHAGATAPGAPAGAPAASPPGCETGQAAQHLRDGSLGCPDGSEPACEDGANRVLSASGALLSCVVPTEAEEAVACEEAVGCTASEPAAPVCEDTCVGTASGESGA